MRTSSVGRYALRLTFGQVSGLQWRFFFIVYFKIPYTSLNGIVCF